MNESSSLAQLAELALIVLTGIVIMSALGVYGLRGFQARRPRPSRYPDIEPLRFQGRGTMTINADDLLASAYRIDYSFPDEALVKVELIERATGNRDVILIKSGSGVEGFDVPQAGHYLLQVEPLAEAVGWKCQIRPVGLKAT